MSQKKSRCEGNEAVFISSLPTENQWFLVKGMAFCHLWQSMEGVAGVGRRPQGMGVMEGSLGCQVEV